MSEEDKLVINTERIQNYVASQVLAEQKYQRENDAKLRAVNQRVPTYEDFRQMVLASHLKPLDKGETLRGAVGRENTGKSWNSVMIGNKSDENSKNAFNLHQDTDISDLVTFVPKSNLEFVKIWRLIDTKLAQNETECNQMKWLFMYNLKAEKISQIFRPEIDGEMLGKFLVLFEFILKDKGAEKIENVVDLLKIFTKCNRFDLNMMFLKATEINAAKSIFQVIEEHGIKDTILKKCYVK
jgi:hypothetical protein